MIRSARPKDLNDLRDIERAAGESFRHLGMDSIAEDEPPTVEELAVFQADGRAWVAVDAADYPVAYLLVDSVDGNAHIEQVSVHPNHARQGIGRNLIEAAAEWARNHDLTDLTLTTFTHVPWNGPYYQRIGFQPLRHQQITSGLRAIREHEAALGSTNGPASSCVEVLPPAKDICCGITGGLAFRMSRLAKYTHWDWRTRRKLAHLPSTRGAGVSSPGPLLIHTPSRLSAGYRLAVERQPGTESAAKRCESPITYHCDSQLLRFCGSVRLCSRSEAAVIDGFHR